MSFRALRSGPVVLIVAVAFALGAVSSASAAGLTKATVKKIAAKVVTKKAPTLSVAHAATATTATTASTATNAAHATDADKVGGLTAAQLGVRPIVFSITGGPYATNQSIGLPGVPAGDYLVGFSGTLGTTANSNAECWIRNATTNAFPVDVQVTSPPSHVPALSGFGYVHVNDGDSLDVTCQTAANWSPIGVFTVIFTPAVGVVNADPEVLPRADRASSPTR